jgi:peptidoglycan/xylan/chitin deacetylase (PgdA/CDA1 family)
MNAQLGCSILAILAYHKIGDPPRSNSPNRWYIPKATFRDHLRYLSSSAWEVISVDALLRALAGSESLPQRAALLTFDDGYKSLLDTASSCLRQFGFPSVAFIPTQFVGGYNDFDGGREPKEAICSWDDLRELERHGCSIQSHGVRHLSMSSLGQEAQEEELVSSKRTIESELGKSVEVFSYPYGRVSEDRPAVSELLKRVGYQAACLFGGGVTALPVKNAYYLPRVDLYPHSDLAKLLVS